MPAKDEVRFDAWRNVLIADWYLDTTESGVRDMTQEMLALYAKQYKKIAIIHVIGVMSAPPSSATRKLMAEILRREQDRIAMTVAIIQGTGFRAASVRAVASGIAMLGKMSFPHEIHPTVEKGVDRVIDYLKYDETCRRHLVKTVTTLVKRPPEFL